MLTLPAALFPLMVECAPLFSMPVWVHATVLVVSAILAPGTRTGTACLRGMGLSQERGVVHALIGVQGLLLAPTSRSVAHF